MELRKPLALLILWTYSRLRLCAIAIYIAFKLPSTWNHREKKTTRNDNSVWNDKLTINFFRRHYSNFDREKYRDTWHIIIRTRINLSQATSHRHLITLKQRRVSPRFLQFFSGASLWNFKLFHCGFKTKAWLKQYNYWLPKHD